MLHGNERDGPFILLWDGGYIAFLSDVIVIPEYQGQGIGRKLVEASIQKLKEGMKTGYKVKLALNAAKGKGPFYEKFGFKVRPNEDAGPGMNQWVIMGEGEKAWKAKIQPPARECLLAVFDSLRKLMHLRLIVWRYHMEIE